MMSYPNVHVASYWKLSVPVNKLTYRLLVSSVMAKIGPVADVRLAYHGGLVRTHSLIEFRRLQEKASVEAITKTWLILDKYILPMERCSTTPTLEATIEGGP